MVSGRGTRGSARGLHGNKQVRFTSPPAGNSKEDQPSKSTSQTTVNPFIAPNITASPFDTPATTVSYNPFAANPFFAPVKETPSSNPFSSFNPENKKKQFASASASASSTQPLKQEQSFRSDQQPVTQTSDAFSNDGREDQLLKSQGIFAPSWPSSPGDPKQKSAMEAFWQAYKGYRTKARSSLIRAGYLDDPDKPKKLSEAIDFKGTCEEMCPEFEKITRINEHDVQGPEKEVAPDGSLWPSPQKMVKALARSAAGQDAPLPMDVRSPAALRRTLDYLLHTVLGDEGNLPSVHGFLWDRTRAIRRDFVFQSSMTSAELSDQVYCLERITRFHVIALHQMSQNNIVAEDFSEQQEVEQLGKALLSLIHAYEDSKGQGIACENEAEFRAYYVLFNCHNSGILETVQDWGWAFWGESEQVKVAVTLVETLQNIWDTRGPLKPHSATDVAQNAYSRFFSIIDDRSVSYTMACFAEIHFNNIRKSALKTILSSYRKQRDQTKDWTLARLNTFLRFDDEEEIIPFGEAYGLRFDEVDGEEYLSFESDDVISDPFPPLKQAHSYCLVERKRGIHSLPEVIDYTVYDETTQGEDDLEQDIVEGLFVKEADSKISLGTIAPPKSAANTPTAHKVVPDVPNGQKPNSTSNSQVEQVVAPKPNPTPFSTFSQPTAPNPFASIFGTSPSPEQALSTQLEHAQQDKSSSVKVKPVNEVPSIFGQKPLNQSVSNGATSTFSFVPTPINQPAPTALKAPDFLGGHSVSSVPSSSIKPPAFLSSNSVSPVPGERIKPPDFLGSDSVSHAHSESIKPPGFLGGHPVSPAPSNSPKPSTFLGQHTVSEPSRLTPPAYPLRPPDPLSFFGKSTKSATEPQTQATDNLLTNRDSPKITVEESPIKHDVSQYANPFVFGEGPVRSPKKLQMDAFAEWMALGDDGVVDQFTTFSIGNILRRTVSKFMQEESARVEKEADQLARMQADRFRYLSIATKYCHLWRDIAHRIWLRRRGREARQARREMAESLRASKAAQSANLVEDFRASASRSRRNSTESLLDATAILNGVHDHEYQSRALAQNERHESANKRQRSSRSINSQSSSTSRHRRGISDIPFRRSLLSDPSYLNGGSRIHFMSNYSLRDEDRRQPSGVQTDYFRLKARGITTLPDGTPLANSVAKITLSQKRSFDGISTPETPKISQHQSDGKSVPAKLAVQLDNPRTSAERDADIQAMKVRAKSMRVGDSVARQHNQKRSFQDEEEELFAKAKRIREQMDEDSEWFRTLRERETKSDSAY